jgi:hypothetical protein
VLGQHVTQLGVGDLLGGADAATAGIVDQHVNRAEPPEGGVDDGRGGLGVADVVLDRQQHVAEALAQVVKARDATRGADDLLAGL